MVGVVIITEKHFPSMNSLKYWAQPFGFYSDFEWSVKLCSESNRRCLGLPVKSWSETSYKKHIVEALQMSTTTYFFEK